MYRVIVTLLVVVGLSGCITITLPVVGAFKTGDEQFRGEATGRLDGTGTLTIRSERGRSCSGSYKRSSSGVTGEGRFTCTDGKTGDFYYTTHGNPNNGEGFGKTDDGDMFRFRFGGPEYVRQQQRAWEALAETMQSLNPPTRTTDCMALAGTVHCTTR